MSATDATPCSIAWVVLQHQELRQRPENRDQIHAEITDRQDVSYNELRAIVVLAKHVQDIWKEKKVRLFLATDSQIADTVLTKGYSKSEDLDKLVYELQQQRGKIRVHTTWVPTEENVADTPSREILNRECRICLRRENAHPSSCTEPLWAEIDPGRIELDPQRKERTEEALYDAHRWILQA